MRKRWGIFLVFLAVACASQKAAVADYLKNLDELGSGLLVVAEELPAQLNKLGEEFDKAQRGLPADLTEGKAELQELRGRLVESREKLNALAPPEAAEELHRLVQADYDKAIETVDAASEMVMEGQKALDIVQGGSGDRTAVLKRIDELKLKGRELGREGDEILREIETDRSRLRAEYHLE